MPRRSGWFLVIEAATGARAMQPVDSQTQVREFVEKLQPITPDTSTWSVEWVTG